MDNGRAPGWGNACSLLLSVRNSTYLDRLGIPGLATSSRVAGSGSAAIRFAIGADGPGMTWRYESIL